MSLSEIVRSKEAGLRQIKDHEVAVVFNAFGDIMVEEHGGRSSVDLGPYIDHVKQVGKATLVHNHPLGWQYPPSDPRHAGGSFSPQDIATACYAELAEIRAVGPLFSYSMRPATDMMWNGEYWVSTVQPSLERHKVTLIRSTLQAVSEGRMSTELAEAQFWHEVWRRVVDDLPLLYRRFGDE